MSERILTGEMDVPIDGAEIKYDPPFTKWCSHQFIVESTMIKPSGRIEARTFKDGMWGCHVAILHLRPPMVIGKDQAGNDMLQPQAPESIGGHISWKSVGE